MRSSSFLALPFIALALLALSACAVSSGRPNEPVSLSGTSLPAAAAQQAESDTPLGRAVLAAVNNHRTAGSLKVDATLQRAASVHAKDMALRNYFSHHNPEGLGPIDRVRTIEPDFQRSLAENNWSRVIRPGTGDSAVAQRAVTEWVNSPRHRASLESKKYTRTGIGVAWRGDEVFIVQLFSN